MLSLQTVKLNPACSWNHYGNGTGYFTWLGKATAPSDLPPYTQGLAAKLMAEMYPDEHNWWNHTGPNCPICNKE